ncbi:MAG: glycosyl transferase, partial [Bacteroidetes bacterium SW_11_45_7]
AYFPISFLAAFYADNLRKKTDRWAWYNTLGLFVIGGLIAIVLAAVPFVGKNTEWLFPYINDPFAKANLSADVKWTGVESVIGFFYLALLIIGYIMIRKQFYLPGVGTFFLATLITVQSVMMVIVPKIEGYTQRAAIAFYKERQGEDCYVEVLGFKSFAHLFYARKLPKNAAANTPKPEGMPFQKWLLKGAIDKPAYFVAKITHADKYKEMPALTVIDEKNGFVFFKREP